MPQTILVTGGRDNKLNMWNTKDMVNKSTLYFQQQINPPCSQTLLSCQDLESAPWSVRLQTGVSLPLPHGVRDLVIVGLELGDLTAFIHVGGGRLETKQVCLLSTVNCLHYSLLSSI